MKRNVTPIHPHGTTKLDTLATDRVIREGLVAVGLLNRINAEKSTIRVYRTWDRKGGKKTEGLGITIELPDPNETETF